MEVKFRKILNVDFCGIMLCFVAEVKLHPYIMAVLETMIKALGGWPGNALDNSYTVTVTLMLSSQCGLFFVVSVHTALPVHMFVHVTNTWLGASVSWGWELPAFPSHQALYCCWLSSLPLHWQLQWYKVISNCAAINCMGLSWSLVRVKSMKFNIRHTSPIYTTS